jgi:hypothetical protein
MVAQVIVDGWANVDYSAILEGLKIDQVEDN